MDEWVHRVLVQGNMLVRETGVNQISLGAIHAQRSQTLGISLISFRPV